jgi:hypothetical protein
VPEPGRRGPACLELARAEPAQRLVEGDRERGAGEGVGVVERLLDELRVQRRNGGEVAGREGPVRVEAQRQPGEAAPERAGQREIAGDLDLEHPRAGRERGKSLVEGEDQGAALDGAERGKAAGPREQRRLEREARRGQALG